MYVYYPTLNQKVINFLEKTVAIYQCEDPQLFSQICCEVQHTFQSRWTESKRSAMKQLETYTQQWYRQGMNKNESQAIDIDLDVMEVAVLFGYPVSKNSLVQIEMIASFAANNNANVMDDYAEHINRIFKGKKRNF